MATMTRLLVAALLMALLAAPLAGCKKRLAFGGSEGFRGPTNLDRELPERAQAFEEESDFAYYWLGMSRFEADMYAWWETGVSPEEYFWTVSMVSVLVPSPPPLQLEAAPAGDVVPIEGDSLTTSIGEGEVM